MSGLSPFRMVGGHFEAHAGDLRFMIVRLPPGGFEVGWQLDVWSTTDLAVDRFVLASYRAAVEVARVLAGFELGEDAGWLLRSRRLRPVETWDVLDTYRDR